MAKKQPVKKTPKPSIIEEPPKQEPNYDKLITLRPKNKAQEKAWRDIHNNDYCFLTGYAGTGKTTLAVLYGVRGFLRGDFQKIYLTRPAVEATENLGFLPGELGAKLKPFLLPVFEAIAKTAGHGANEHLTELKNRIMAATEMVPLAYVRGRTFENAFCIMDEAQNASAEAIEMYMTRIGEGSKMVLCGDDHQPDIRDCVLGAVARAFDDAKQAGWCEFSKADIVRHPRIGAVIDIMSQFKKSRKS